MKMRGRSAFTLVELLVVIAIIGMLAALLLPAVQQARESGRRTTCLNNMRQLTVATRNYESRKRELPGYANVVGKSSNVATPNRLGPWVVMLLPDMERTDVYQTWNTDPHTVPEAPAAPYIELLVCPSNPPDSPGQPSLSYVANCGKMDPTPPATTPPSASGTPEKLANGVLFNRYTDPSTLAANTFTQISISLDHIANGPGNTLMLSENNQAGPYISGGPFDNANATPPYSPVSYNKSKNDVTDTERLTGFEWVPNPSFPPSPPAITALKINSDRDNLKGYASASGANYLYSRPSSRHPGGVNVAMCGSETFFMREDIDYSVYQQLMSSNAKKSDIDDKTHILSDSDYK